MIASDSNATTDSKTEDSHSSVGAAPQVSPPQRRAVARFSLPPARECVRDAELNPAGRVLSATALLELDEFINIKNGELARRATARRTRVQDYLEWKMATGQVSTEAPVSGSVTMSRSSLSDVGTPAQPVVVAMAPGDDPDVERLTTELREAWESAKTDVRSMIGYLRD